MDEILAQKITEMLKDDFSELEELMNEIMTKGNLDKEKLGKAYFVVQKIQMYLYKLYSLTS
ncbi:hypothetical protein [Sulfolobus monocaudavirus SMV3]|uniref:hypothetical protein n=1 Tax=Sulfolobus monocaudavirus SMV3 TaxID=1732177 RepID=UPI0007065D05|nr:hypothetical protein AXI69_gp48 [Sulfolobus monocaudavirus SMV3]ALG96985.1 hypothetical protein [Sulfolobus monocaudavirus SMV3]